MSIEFSNELSQLAELFPSDRPLFAVGGCVRDRLLLREVHDVDLAAALTPEELKDVLEGSAFACVSGSPRLGTVIIKGCEANYEFTTFRRDSYPAQSGVHRPAEVEFTDSSEVDARRRDFRCNALYADLARGEVIDPTGGGLEDIRRRELNTVDAPDRVLGEDGLRIMRLFRFVSVLGFEAGQETYEACVRNRALLADIAPERIREELDKLLGGEFCGKALRMTYKSRVLEEILPEVAQGGGEAQNPIYHRYDVLEHCIRTAEACPPDIRLAGLLHDVAKPTCRKRDGNIYVHAQDGARMCGEIMRRLKYSVKETELTMRLVGAHTFDGAGDARVSTVRRFAAANFDILPKLTALMDADAAATGVKDSSIAAGKLREQARYITALHLPISAAGLAIDGRDLTRLGYKGKAVGETLRQLVDIVLLEQKPNEREALEQYAQERLCGNRPRPLIEN